MPWRALTKQLNCNRLKLGSPHLLVGYRPAQTVRNTASHPFHYHSFSRTSSIDKLPYGFTHQKMSTSTATLIDGKAIAESIRAELRTQLDELKSSSGKTPCLAFILVGDNRDSATYVRLKKKACTEVAIDSKSIDLPAETSQGELLQIIQGLNNDQDVDGILVQLPLPESIDTKAVLQSINPEKDVDGLSIENAGRLHLKGYTPLFYPCTPKGCIDLLDRSKVEISGKVAVVVGRSNLVGGPIAAMLLQRDATVIQCHSKTKDLKHFVQMADILVSACGNPELIRGDWLKPGVVILDVGQTYVPDSSRKSGYRASGDIAFTEAQSVAAAITPAQGGVGPMTIAELLANTVEGFRRRVSRPDS